jgi:hypothetical protein
MYQGKSCYRSVHNLLASNLQCTKYRTKYIYLVLFWCEIWNISFRDEHRQRVYENRVLRKIKREKVTGSWRKLHNKELNILPSSPITIQVIK